MTNILQTGTRTRCLSDLQTTPDPKAQRDTLRVLGLRVLLLMGGGQHPFWLGCAVRMRRNPGDTGHLKQVRTGLALGSEGSWRRRECIGGSLGLCARWQASGKVEAFQQETKGCWEREVQHLVNAHLLGLKKKTKQIQINVPEWPPQAPPSSCNQILTQGPFNLSHISNNMYDGWLPNFPAG